ncbi:MAG: bifunctional DNA-formamidopyrimidine glycosylase/DNA-(apurinic or apyrimidinic site) lyase [Bryobacterales bacterium]
MPELPEVETIIRGLSRKLIGRRIANVEFPWPGLVVGDVDETTRQLRGQRIHDIHRHGKYIVVELSRARKRSCLVIHLRMTGNLLINGEPGPYTRGILYFEGGPVLVYHDIRKFGRWQWSPELPPRLPELGPDPLDISDAEFLVRVRSRRAMAKALLLDQEFLRGLGNIYADEALFRAGIHPRTNTAGLGPTRAHRLWTAIREVLNDAIAQGGSTISNYVDSNGSEGYFQLSTFVYGKTGEKCKKCKSAIRRIIVASRSTHFCPRCQRR